MAFALDVPAAASASAKRELFVLADNRFNRTTAPMHTGGDFWHFGGLMRSVELHTLPAPTPTPTLAPTPRGPLPLSLPLPLPLSLPLP